MTIDPGIAEIRKITEQLAATALPVSISVHTHVNRMGQARYVSRSMGSRSIGTS